MLVRERQPTRHGLDALAMRLGSGDGRLSLARRLDIADAILEPLRAFPEQWNACRQLARGDKPLIAVQGNRRTGKTEGPVGRWPLAACVARDHFVVRILTQTLSAPTDNWLARAGDGASALRLIEEHGLTAHAKVRWTAGAVRSIEFSWGSAIYVHDIANMRAIEAKRGFRAHVFIVDEAQSIPLIGQVLGQLVLPTLADFGGRVLLCGTPGKDIGTLFYRASRGLLPEWTSCHLRSWQNPFFGLSVPERWDRILERAILPGRARYNLSESDVEHLRALTPGDLDAISAATETGDLAEWAKTLDADLLREFFGRWVADAAEYVFSWHRAAAAGHLYWIDQATVDPRAYERGGWTAETRAAFFRARAARLPKVPHADGAAMYEWRAVIGLDIGYDPDPAAWVVIVWARNHRTAYVLYSETRYQCHDTEIFEHTVALGLALEGAGIPVQVVVADVSGDRKGTQADWDVRLSRRMPREVPVRPPRKADKFQQIRAFNLDLEAGRLRVIAGDALDTEGMHLRYRPRDADDPKPREIDKRRAVYLPDGTEIRPGDHVLDATRYALAHVEPLFSTEEQPRTAEELTSQGRVLAAARADRKRAIERDRAARASRPGIGYPTRRR